MRTAHRLLGIVVGLALAACADSRPNIVFILADDLGYGDLGVYGGRLISTPRLDRMAAEGSRFTDVYAGGPVCAPTRCSLMTGRHSGHCTVRDNLSDLQGTREERLVPLAADDVTVAEVLRRAGYATGGFGKWALGNPGTSGVPERHGFDDFFGYLDQRHAWNQYTDYLYRNGQRIEIPENADRARNRYVPDLLIDEALAFMRRNRDRRFFLYLPVTLPHPPYRVPDLGAYAERDWSATQKAFAATVTHLDGQVGRVLDELDELGLSSRTVVFFSSDNGPPRALRDFFDSAGSLRGGKAELWEGGIRMPMLVRWPGRVPAGRVSDDVWWQVDFLPTAVDLAAGTLPPGVDGRSVVGLLTGGPAGEERPLYWEYQVPFHQAVRLGRWKGIRFGTAGRLLLYDLVADPGETTDRAAEHPEVVARLERVLAGARTDSPHWRAAKYLEPVAAWRIPPEARASAARPRKRRRGH